MIGRWRLCRVHFSKRVTPFVLSAVFFLGISVGGANAQDADILSKARSYAKAADYDAVLALLLDETASPPDGQGAEFYLLLAEAYLETGAGQTAIAALERAQDAGADYTRTAVLRAKSQLIQGNFSAARAALRGAELDGPALYESLIIQADAHLAEAGRDQEKLGRAEALYRRAFALDASSYKAPLGLARMALSAGDMAGAQANLAEAASRAPGDSMVLYTQGLMARFQGDQAGAQAFFASAVEAFPGHHAARLELAAHAIDRGDIMLAERHLDKVYSVTPTHPMALFLSAVISARNGEYEDADGLLLQARPMVERYLPALYVRGMVSLALERAAPAARDLRRVLALRGDAVPVRMGLASALLRLKEYAEAQRVLEPLLQADGSPAAFRMGAVAAAGLGQAEKAEVMLRRAGSDDGATAQEFEVQYALLALSRGEELLARDRLRGVHLGQVDRAADIRSLALLAAMELRGNDIAAARATVEKLIDTAPERAIGYNILGTVELEAGAPALAVKAFDEALKRSDTYHAARRNKAIAFIEMGEYRKGADILHAVLAVSPSDVRAKALLGRAYLALGDGGKAASYFAEVARVLPRSGAPQVDLARALLLAKDYRAARDRARAAVPLVQNDPELLRRLGLVFMDLDEHRTAARLFARMVAFSGDNAQDFVLWGRAQLRAGLGAGARQAFMRAEAIWSEDEALEHGLGWYLFAADAAVGKAAEAQERFMTLADARRPADITAGYVGGALVRLGFSDIAVDYLEGLQSENAQIALAQAYEAQGKIDDAIAVLKALHEPLTRAVRGQLASLYQRQGDLVSAAAQYETLLNEGFKDGTTAARLALLYLAQGDSRSIDTAGIAYRLEPEDPQVLDTYGWVRLQAARDIAGAVSALEKASRRRPASAEIRYHLGMAYLAAGRRKAARATLQEALGLAPEFNGKGDAVRQLEMLEADRQ